MPRHLEREIERLKEKILELGKLVERRLVQAVTSIEERNATEAKNVIEGDFDIDQMEVEIEEDCLKILALHQPVAIDLRFIVAVLKMNNDLERIGDLAVNIADRSIYLAQHKAIEIPFDFSTLTRKACSMLQNSLEALINLDTNLARQICKDDVEVDRIHREAYERVEAAIRLNSEHLERLIRFLSVARNLERIADHATNIAEDVIYLAEGEITRHKTVEFKT